MDRGASWAIVHRVSKSWIRRGNTHTHKSDNITQELFSNGPAEYEQYTALILKQESQYRLQEGIFTCRNKGQLLLS